MNNATEIINQIKIDSLIKNIGFVIIGSYVISVSYDEAKCYCLKTFTVKKMNLKYDLKISDYIKKIFPISDSKICIQTENKDDYQTNSIIIYDLESNQAIYPYKITSTYNPHPIKEPNVLIHGMCRTELINVKNDRIKIKYNYYATYDESEFSGGPYEEEFFFEHEHLHSYDLNKFIYEYSFKELWYKRYYHKFKVPKMHHYYFTPEECNGYQGTHMAFDTKDSKQMKNEFLKELKTITKVLYPGLNWEIG